MKISRSFRLACGLLGLAGCASPPHFVDPGATPVAIGAPVAAQAEASALRSEIAAQASLTGAELRERHAVAHGTLPYEPLDALHLDLIDASSQAMTGPERERLARDGMLIRESHRYPSFGYGYREIYAQDLPLFISADSVLEAVHRSYDAILAGIETSTLRTELLQMLQGMRARLVADPNSRADLRADADMYLAVATALLEGAPASCVAGGDSATAQRFVDMARAHEGEAGVQLFGDPRIEDFSQYEPRGHYTDTPELQRYFMAMMWLGRVDMRLIETEPDGSTSFRRGQFEVALTLRSLVDDDALAHWRVIDDTISAFVGEHDSMTLPQIDQLLTSLGAHDARDLEGASDDRIAQAILDGGFGAQRIASQIMIVGPAEDTLPLARSFALFGQRYVVDSHVFSNVVFDRVQHGDVMRMMPSTLDVAYAALGNDDAARLLAPELDSFEYAPDLEGMRLLVDAHDATYWNEDLYTGWLGSLRTLSPHAGAPDTGLPAIARTEPWSRRILETQLASWAELRHDTILYAKQSYTGGNACEFPDAYVEPYPAFFDGIAAWARHGAEVTTGIGDPEYGPHAYFLRLVEIADMLGDMARAERSGMPFDAAQMAFINRTVTVSSICGEDTLDGWYRDLYYSREDALELDPVIADVHTQPTDEAGNFVGRILSVGTGMPRAAIFTFETCTGPRAYVGLVSSYFERVTENFERPTDEEWSDELMASGHPADPAFLGDLIMR